MKNQHIGKVYGHLTVVKFAEQRPDDKYYLCQCDCGGKIKARIYNLVRGIVVGCYRCRKKRKREALKRQPKHPSVTHGATKNRFACSEYWTWCAMRARCTNPTHNSWKHYGGRGITVCDRWLHSFKNFIDDMGMKPDPSLTLDRINNDGNYEPSNCRWTDRKTQWENRRRVTKCPNCGHVLQIV